MNVLSTVTHTVKAFVGRSLKAQVQLATPSGSTSLISRLAGKQALMTISNQSNTLAKWVNESRLSSDQLVRRTEQLARCLITVKPGSGPECTQLSNATNDILRNIQDRCRTDRAKGQLKDLLSSPQRHERALLNLGAAFMGGKLADDDALKHAVGVVSFFAPLSGPDMNFVMRREQVLDEVATKWEQWGFDMQRMRALSPLSNRIR
ncbi:hypothetical protein [Stenotrophomonas sp. PS02289]|uniref:hypothetical protein n=1 Tax=Stenotrophomonas sp. PS02289 TaxID=2991422 RepID=UPI00249A0C17|nr:hypothetical protein [Stenotrophomonas sp. PS02289]